eukprot:1614300-Prymnesium_polylepis.1
MLVLPAFCGCRRAPAPQLRPLAKPPVAVLAPLAASKESRRRRGQPIGHTWHARASVASGVEGCASAPSHGRARRAGRQRRAYTLRSQQRA